MDHLMIEQMFMTWILDKSISQTSTVHYKTPTKLIEPQKHLKKFKVFPSTIPPFFNSSLTFFSNLEFIPDQKKVSHYLLVVYMLTLPTSGFSLSY